MRISLVALIVLTTACSAATTVEDTPVHIRLVQIEGREIKAVLTPLEAERVMDITSRMKPSDGWAMTPPPWDAVLGLEYADGRERVFRLTATVLRENTQDAWAMHLAGPDGTPDPAVQDYDLEYEDEEWLWGLFARHLGPTKVKQYQTLEDPTFPKL